MRNKLNLSRIQVNQYQHGFTLVELLLASLFGLLILAGVFNLYLTSKQNYTMIAGFARIQQHARLAVKLLNDAIQSAGNMGCGQFVNLDINNLAFQKTGILSSNDMLQAYSAATAAAQLPGFNPKNIKPGTDVLVVRKIGHPYGFLGADMPNKKKLEVRKKLALTPSELLVISDCQSADLLQAAAISVHKKNQIIIASKPLQKEYSQFAYLAPFTAEVYFIGNTERKGNLGYPIYALYRKDLYTSVHHPAELIEGIDNMQLRFGVRQHPGMPLHYTRHPLKWQNVVSVQIAFLLDSIQPIANKALQYQFLGKTYAAKNHRLYKEWDTYINVRGRD